MIDPELIGLPSSFMLFEPTAHLRFVLHRSIVTEEMQRILQQLWQDRLSGNTEWRDVPLEPNP